MAQALFDAIAGVAAALDNQTSLAVQSLLESQTNVTVSDSTNTSADQIGSSFDMSSTTLVEEEDVFLCGKCKKHYTSLSAFVSHKRESCGFHIANVSIPSPSQVPSMQNTDSLESLPSPSIGQTLTSLSPQQIQVSAGYATIPTSPLPHTVVLNESELLTLTSSIDNGTLSLPTSIANSLFLPHISSSTSAVPATQSVLIKTEANPDITSSTCMLTSGKKTLLMPKIAIFDDKHVSLNINEIHATVVKPVDKTANAQHSCENEKQKPGKLQCSYCDKIFTKNFDLQQHIRSHTGEKPFQCIVCGRAFAQKSNVKKHMQTHKVWPEGLSRTLPKQPAPQKAINTVEESSSSAQENALENTGLQVNTAVDESGKMHIVIDNSYTCNFCGINFKTYFELKAHFKYHKSEQVYKCILKSCGLTFQELDLFLEHTKSHEHEMTYRCHLCSKTFSSLCELGVHQYSHTLYPIQSSKPSSKPYRCNICMSKYASPEALDHHLATTDHNYPCPHCDKVYSSERYLRRHLPTHGTMTLHTCGVCAKAFKTEYLLRMHVLIHSGDKPFSCNCCDAAFNRKDKLKRHLLIHEPVKRFKCPFRSYIGCLKEFNRPDKLKAHIITHSGLKPFKCTQCCRSFSRKPHLREHEKIHCEDFQFRCNLCEKHFTKQKQLADHTCKGKEKGKKESHARRQRKKTMERKQPGCASKRRGRPKKKVESNESENEQQSNGTVTIDCQVEDAVSDKNQTDELTCSPSPSLNLDLNNDTNTSMLRTLLMQLEPKCDPLSD